MFFLLIQKVHLKQKLAIEWGETIDVCSFATSVTSMVRGFAIGNLLIAAAMALVTIVVLFAMETDGAVLIGTVSGFLNLIPFVGAILAALLRIGAALFEHPPLSHPLVILLTVTALHLFSANLLIPRMIGRRVSISPVAATVGILFWGWLWGLIGVLLAVPLTAFVKIVADSHSSLNRIANLLAERPRAVPPFSRATEASAEVEYPHQKRA
jgi:AI-2 transport protein TqsA